VKGEVGGLRRGARFNGQSIIGSEFCVGANANLQAANTNANLGLAACDGWSEEAGNTNGVVDLGLRGIDNRAQTLGGNGSFIVTIYQGDISISNSTGQIIDTAPITQVATNVIALANVVVTQGSAGGFVGAAPALGVTDHLEKQTAATQATQFNAVGFNSNGSIDYNLVRTIGTQTISQTRANYGYDGTSVLLGVGPMTTAVTTYGLTVGGRNQPIFNPDYTSSGATPAVVGEDLVFTAFFEFGDLDGDGQNDVMIKRATVDGELLVDAGDAAAADVTLLTGVTLDFNNSDADFSSAGGISMQTQRNAGLSIVLDPSKAGGNFNLGVDAAGDVQGLFQANANRFAQATIEAFTGSGSSVAEFEFKVGTGIVPDEDEIDIQLGGLTLDQLGVENAQIITKSAADASNTAVAVALDYLVQLRSDVGASVNRLEVASDNVAISSENLEAARSRLLDLNVAEEITVFTSKQILLQSGTSVLAQANQLPQNLLRLYA